jgi:succinate dehydrogenase flavin-adding protein (antitoxin of CptAB toxin-antitoxin module)
MKNSERLWRLRRSTLELDILLSRFFKLHYDLLSSKEQNLFTSMLLLDDIEWQAFLQTEHPLVVKIRHCQEENGI